MKLGKPPVIEAWIEFKIDLTDEHSVWDANAANEFVAEHFPTFPHTDQMALAKITIDPRTHKPTTEIAGIERIRAFTENRDKCIQAGRNFVIYNHIKKGDCWPGYQKLEPEAFEALAKYMEFRGLPKLSGVALHYRDVCRMPQDDSGRLELTEYFTVHPQVPDIEFGTIGGFTIGIQTNDVCKDGSVTLTMQSMPRIDDTETMSAFTMDWHTVCTKTIDTIDTAKEWLGNAHNALRAVFKAAFTEKGFAQFEPIESEGAVMQEFNAQFEHFLDDAPACDVCGAITVRHGTCYKCFNCGNSMAAS